MPISAEGMRSLADLGLDLETVTHIVTIFERDASRDGRDGKSLAAARSRRYRARKSTLTEANDAVSLAHGVTPNVTIASRDAERDGENRSQLTSLLSSEVESGIQEVSKKDTASVNGRAKVSRGTRLDQSAELSDADRQFARDQGLKDGQIGALWVEFIDYWIAIPGSRGTKLNWSATWRNNVRRVAAKGKPNGTGRQQNLGDVARELADEARKLEYQAGLSR